MSDEAPRPPVYLVSLAINITANGASSDGIQQSRPDPTPEMMADMIETMVWLLHPALAKQTWVTLRKRVDNMNLRL